MEVGGLFSDFEAIRTASRDRPESRPNALKITKETTPDLVWWSSCTVMRPPLRGTTREDAIVPRLGPNGLKIEKETTHDLLSRRRFMKMA